MSPGKKTRAEIPYRPGYGVLGKPVTLYANYFELLPPANMILFSYKVDIRPVAGTSDNAKKPADAVEPVSAKEQSAPVGRKLSEIITILLQTLPYSQYADDVVTDYRSTLLSRRQLRLDATGWEINIPHKGRNYQAYVTPNGTVTVTELTDYLNSASMDRYFIEKATVLKALNIFVNHYARSSSDIVTLGRNQSFFLKPPLEWKLGAGLAALRGFFSSVRAATSRILINVNVSHAAVFRRIRLHDLIEEWTGINDWNLSKLHSFLKGLRITLDHLEKKDGMGKPILKIKTISALAKTR